MNVWRKIGEYLWLVKKDPNEPKSQWLGYMNTINRISIWLFIIAIIIIIVENVRC